MKKLLVLLSIGLVSAGLGYFAFQWQAKNQGVLLQNHGYTGGDFQLQGAEGKVSLSDFKGQPVLIYFGYAFCPDVCPTSLAIMAEAMKQLEADSIAVKGLFISVDPERDTPKILAEYAPFFHPNITGVTSDIHRILEVATRYGVYYKKVENEDPTKAYLMDHTSRTYIINSEGQLAAIADHGQSAKELLEKVRTVL